MKHLVLAVLLAVVLSFSVQSGSVYTNDTGQPSYGIRVTFSQQVEIVDHSSALPAQSPAGSAGEFTFLGGELLPGGTFWLSWAPSSAEVVGIKWMPSETASQGFNFTSTRDLKTLVEDSGPVFTGVIIPTFPALQVDADQEFRLLVKYANGGFRQLSQELNWSSSDPDVGYFAANRPDIFVAKSSGITDVTVVFENVSYSTQVAVYETAVAVDGDLAEWDDAYWYLIPESFWQGTPVQIHQPGQGQINSVTPSESRFFQDPAVAHTRAIAARYTDAGFDIAIKNCAKIDPTGGIWVDLHFRDNRLDRMLMLPNRGIVAPKQDFSPVGDLSAIDKDFAYGPAALEIHMPWRELDLDISDMNLLQDVTIRFHAQRERGGLIEIVHYRIPASYVSHFPLDSSHVVAVVPSVSPQRLQPGEETTLQCRVLDDKGILWPIHDYTYECVANGNVIPTGFMPLKEGETVIGWSWNGLIRNFSIPVLDLELKIESQNIIGLQSSGYSMPLPLTFSVNSSPRVRMAWFPSQSIKWTQAMNYAGPWGASQESTFLLESNRKPVTCTLLIETESGIRYWVEEDFDLAFEAGRSVLLDATMVLPEVNCQWEQVFGGWNTWEYITSTHVELTPLEAGKARFVPTWPGVYRFQIDGQSVDIRVSIECKRNFEVLGLIFWDWYGEWDPTHIVGSEAFSWAVDYASDLSANTIGIVNFSLYAQLYPYPIIRVVDDGSSLNEKELGALVALAELKGLDFLLSESLWANYDETGIHPNDPWKAAEAGNQSWWQNWFEQFKDFVVDQGSVAQRLGIEWYQALGSPSYMLQYPEQCAELADQIRQIYSGAFGVRSYATNRPTGQVFSKVDFYIPYVATMGGFPLSPLSNPESPTVEEITDKMLEYFAAIKTGLGPAMESVKVFPVLNAASMDGQNGFKFEEPLPRSKMDLQEQVDYYDAFFRAVYLTPWIDGVIVRGPGWFDQLDFPGNLDSFSNIVFNGKPAEEVVKLWFTIFKAGTPTQK